MKICKLKFSLSEKNSLYFYSLNWIFLIIFPVIYDSFINASDLLMKSVEFFNLRVTRSKIFMSLWPWKLKHRSYRGYGISIFWDPFRILTLKISDYSIKFFDLFNKLPMICFFILIFKLSFNIFKFLLFLFKILFRLLFYLWFIWVF